MGALGGSSKTASGSKRETCRPLRGAQCQRYANRRQMHAAMGLAGHWRGLFQAKFGKEGEGMKTTYFKIGQDSFNMGPGCNKGDQVMRVMLGGWGRITCIIAGGPT